MFSLLIANLYFIVSMYHIFCIQSSFEEHLGCVQILPIINIAAKNLEEHVSLSYVEAFWGVFAQVLDT